jgi:hypothetical protein
MKNSRVFAFFGLLASLILISSSLTSCGISGKSKSINACKDLVREKLRSPSTAKFPEVNYEDIDGKSFEISGSFDAQNGFGAMLRGSFKCMGFEDEELRLIYAS